MRRTWVHRPGHPKANDMGMVNVADLGDDVRLSEARSGSALITDRWREGSRATDGEDIGTRAKEREYMHRNGLAHAADFSNTWQQAAKQRAEYFSRGSVDRELMETVGRAAYELKGMKR